MKVLLIYPPADHMITTNLPDVVDDERGAYPPLGLMYVAAYALKNLDVEVKILDSQFETTGFEGIRKTIASFAPDVVGIQAMTFTLIDAIMTADIVKEIKPETHVTIGGPHCNIFPEETLALRSVDSIVLNEGEITFTNLLRALKERRPLSQVQGIGYKERDGTVRFTPRVPLLDDLDQLPHPARTLLPYEKYFSVLSKYAPVTTMMTSRGCPYQCVFCDRPYLGKEFRSRSALNVVEEMQECIELGIQEIMIYDDTFSIHKQRVHEICDEIVRRELPVKWDIRTSVNAVDDKLLHNLARAGCQRIHYGIESGNKEIQTIIKKFLDLDRVQHAVKVTKGLGMETLGYFMIGNATETREQMEQTIEFARRVGVDYAHISIHTPFPATESYRMGFEKGMYRTDFWKEFARNPRPDFAPPVWDEVLSREELIEVMYLFYRRFYMRPGYLANKLLKVRSLGELNRKARMGLRLFAKALTKSKAGIGNNASPNGNSYSTPVLPKAREEKVSLKILR